MAQSILLTLTPQAATALEKVETCIPVASGVRNAPKLPLPHDGLQYGYQTLFGPEETASLRAGYQIITCSGAPMPMVQVYDDRLRTLLRRHLPSWSATQPCGGLELYVSADIILMAAKECKKQEPEEANALPKFAKLFDAVFKKCIKAMDKYKECPDIYGIYDFDFQPNRGHAYKYWNICMALWVGQKAVIYVTEEDCIAANGIRHESVLQRARGTHRSVKLQFSISNRNGVLVKELRWGELPNLSRFGINFEGQTSINHHDISEMNIRTSSQNAEADKGMESLRETVAQLEQRLAELESGYSSATLLTDFEEV